MDISDILGNLGPWATSPISPFRLKGNELASVIGAAGHMNSAGIAANAGVTGDLIRGNTALRVTDAKESGDNMRQRLMNNAQLMLEDMRQKGALTRTGMEQSGATTRTGMQEAGALQRTDLMGRNQQALQNDLFRLKEDAADKIGILQNRLLNGYQSSKSIAIPNAVDQIEAENEIGRQIAAQPQQQKEKRGMDYLDGFNIFGGNGW